MFYAVLEIAFASATVAQTCYKVGDDSKPFSVLMIFAGGVYVLVRGFDNFSKALTQCLTAKKRSSSQSAVIASGEPQSAKPLPVFSEGRAAHRRTASIGVSTIKLARSTFPRLFDYGRATHLGSG